MNWCTAADLTTERLNAALDAAFEKTFGKTDGRDAVWRGSAKEQLKAKADRRRYDASGKYDEAIRDAIARGISSSALAIQCGTSQQYMCKRAADIGLSFGGRPGRRASGRASA